MNWRRLVKWMAIGAMALIGLIVIVAGTLLISFGHAANRVYEVPVLDVVASTDSAVIRRGRHLAESSGCIGCHGEGLAGGSGESIGPIGVMVPPNLTTGKGGVGGAYTDGELVRAVQHGIRSNGRTLFFMPSSDFSWWPESDLIAVVSYLRSLPPMDRQVGSTRIKVVGRLLERFGVMPLMSASQVDHGAGTEDVPAPEPTARYGQFLARRCMGCHGDRLSGGRVPGAPSDLPIPRNLTPHETGLGGWSRADFVTLLNTGRRPDGSRVDPFMSTASTRAMNDLEKNALWAYLQSLEPLEFGNR